MKLLFCPACRAIRDIKQTQVECDCGESNATINPYTGIVEASIDTIIIGIPDHAFNEALAERPDEGKGLIFPAFILPRKTKAVEYSL